MRSRSLPLALISGFIFLGGNAFADEPSAADVSAARALGVEGVKLADANNCAEAIDKLSRAEKIFHAPTTLARLGECQVKTGKIVEGTENLNRVARESLAPGAPPAFVQAQERAKKVLAEYKGKIANLKIAVAGPHDQNYTVKVDGTPIPLANLNMNRPMDPGAHEIEASGPGLKPAKQTVTLAEGGTDSVALTLEPDPNAVKAEPPPPVTQPQPTQPQPAEQTIPQNPPPAAEGSTSRAPAYLAFGVAGVGLLTGAIFGLMANGKKSDLDTACGPTKQCGPDAQKTIDSGKTFGTISTVGFVIGAVAAIAGAYLFLTESQPKKQAKGSGHVFVTVDSAGLVF